MDESGGSGQPRSGNDEPTERHAAPATPATGSARPDPAPRGTDEPTMVVRRLDAPSDPPDDGTNGGGTSGQEPSEEKTAPKDSEEKAAPKDKAVEEPTGENTPATKPDVTKPDATKPPATGRHRHEAHTGHPEHNPADPQHAGDRTLAHSGLSKGRPPRRERGPGGGLLMGRPFGVPVYVAPSWFLVAALITWVFGGQLDRVLPELGAARYLVSLFFAVAFYASVLVHELAHTVAALRFKLPVRRIQLQFFGGVSEIEKEAETPGREFWLAFVGPLLSLALSGLFYLAMQPVEPGTVPGVLLAGLMISNLIVAAFNLLPGLPLDGGRMLRAVIWKITGKPMSGTVAAAWVGRALAVSVLIGLPLLTQSGALGSNAEDNVGMDTVMDALLAAILAAIIWTGAGNSLRMARLREHLPELRARTLTRRAVPVETDTPLSEALRRANAAGARALVVVDADGHPLSLVREAAIVGVPEHRRPWVAVSGLAQDLTDGMRVSAELAGEDLLDALRATPATEYLVVEETGEIYGVLSAADVERAFVKAMARPN
ncbi:site-2 protease family protein [Streptomyces lincolnensis]|uniref:site-2 protease family protein n=1 Tax=Streptomyces lincolnensis TaxID=1915 RepID=UPI001E4ADE9F|nr:site-2 protease family protein [Streptomyces lincolnensis]MCD7441929.1 site-2 protease family protein [Streptomyces lincolnensis]